MATVLERALGSELQAEGSIFHFWGGKELGGFLLPC